MAQLVMPGIRAVKSKQLDEARRLLVMAVHALHERGAAQVVLACTEVPLVLAGARLPCATVDPTRELARASVAWSLRARMSVAC